MTDRVILYLSYLALSIALTVWVGRTLSRNGRVFLEDAFDDERLALSVNHLLVVGFYLLNLGYVSVAMRDAAAVDTTSEVLEQLSKKVGLVLLVLGVVHFFNLFALSRYRRNRLLAASDMPPLPPAVVLQRPQVDPAQQAFMQAQMHASMRAHQAAEAAWAQGQAAEAARAQGQAQDSAGAPGHGTPATPEHRDGQ